MSGCIGPINDSSIDDVFYGQIEYVDTIADEIQHRPSRSSQRIVPPSNHHTWLSTQPDGCWYQFGEGTLTLVVNTTDPKIITHCWEGTFLQLLYTDSMTCVGRNENTHSPVFKEVSRSVDSTTLTYQLRVEEITKNHQSRPFCFALSIGDLRVVTNGFLVKTKRTKRKRSCSSRPICSETVYQRQTRSVLERIQWRIGGYSTVCEGYVDFMRPIFTCMLCNGQMEFGHLPGCLIRTLL
jgi:hypothetical protein